MLIAYVPPLVLRCFTRRRRLHSLISQLSLPHRSPPQIRAKSYLLSSCVKELRLVMDNGTKYLDKTQFNRTINLPYVIVDKKYYELWKDMLKHNTFRRSSSCNCRPDTTLPSDDPLHETHKKLFLNNTEFTCLEDVQRYAKEKYRERLAPQFPNPWTRICRFGHEDVYITYENVSISDAISAILPEDLVDTSVNRGGYKAIGHIAQVNLQDDVLPYKYAIGQILLDKVSGCKTVVNKLGKIENLYRNLEFELIAGEPDYVAECAENDCVYKVDFTRVYWNPGLSSERERTVKAIDRGSIVFDVFAGIGPFSIPLVKKRCEVHANDWNPDCYEHIIHNIEKNCKTLKEAEHLFTPYNMEGREFLRTVVVPTILGEKVKHGDGLNSNENVHIIMNLPGSAAEFLELVVKSV
ncbi:hypothetical protein ACOME3_000145 [Neoechinorhynchus agilis]